jgi:cytochrome P450
METNCTIQHVSIVELFRMMPQFRRNALAAFTELAKRADIVRITGLWTSFMLTDPHHIEHVMQGNSRNYNKGRVYKELIPSTGEGLFVTDGEVWLRQRRLAQPAFHKDKIASFGAIITTAADEMLARWEPHVNNGTSIDIGSEMLQLTLSIVGRALFSRDLSYGARVVDDAFAVIRNHTMRRLTSFVKLPQSLPLPRNRRFRQAIATVDELIYEVIAERRNDPEAHDDLLAMLMAAQDEETGGSMSDKELRDQALTLIGAGYETTTQALTWTWYLLAKHPAEEERLHSEVDGVLGGRTPTYEDLSCLRYCGMVFQEAMRLYPPAWMLARTAIDVDNIGGHTIPPRSEVMMLTAFTHRHPQYWNQPDAFNPDNFLPESVAARPRFAYFPFGGGPRQCIGNNFAMMEAQLIIAMVAQRFRLKLVSDEASAEASVTLRPRDPVRMTLQPR